ncbi:putative Caspase-3 [Hypsibius exemplaris]|uniref:Caspase-3 n=1 Tax=Hypsibius exemplaris TaxID=2072580 RepID=A0A9X6NB03_HYPEX|nr:putative Caspase-3 [Hypsibius exemplaris]
MEEERSTVPPDILTEVDGNGPSKQPSRRSRSLPTEESGGHSQNTKPQGSTDSVTGLDEYPMTYPRRGHAVIFNNYWFAEHSLRDGTDTDVVNLQRTLGMLGFKVTVHKDLTAPEMEVKMKELARDDHSNADCFFAVFLSHGAEGGIFGKIGFSRYDALTGDFHRGDICKTLVGKPKIFIIQACRGNESEEAVAVSPPPPDDGYGEIETDGPTVAAGSDILYAFASGSGSAAFRSPEHGSWFIQTLCQYMCDYADSSSMDFQRILTKVSQQVSTEFACNNTTSGHHNRKQAPTVETTFTKLLYLRPKAKTRKPKYFQ